MKLQFKTLNKAISKPKAKRYNPKVVKSIQKEILVTYEQCRKCALCGCFYGFDNFKFPNINWSKKDNHKCPICSERPLSATMKTILVNLRAEQFRRLGVIK